jgi:Ca-activated chloride channel family protein
MGQLSPAVDDVSAPAVTAFATSNGQLAFGHPLWLLALLAAPFLALVMRRSLADFSRRQLRLQTLLRALVLAGVAIALAGPTLRRPARAVSAVALVDVSDSVSDDALRFANDAVATLARTAARRGDPPPRVVRFAARAEEVVDGAAAQRLTAPAGSATDLALAAGFGAGLVDATAIPRLLMISDGVPTRGDLGATAERLRDRGTPLYALALPSDQRGDVAVDGLTAPDDIRARTPFRVDVRLLADRATEARVRIDGGGDAHVAIDEPEQTLALAPGATTASFTVRITEPGTATLHVKTTATGGDRHPENDEGVLAIETEHDPRILVLEGTPGASGSFGRALAAEHIAADVRAARGLPRDADFAHYDLVVLADVPRAMLPDATLAALDGFVRQGGGLLVGGGTQSFGPGGYLGTRLESMLPVRLDQPDRREEATLALALVIDRSGSMAGPRMELTKEAARATAEALPNSDQIAVIVFDTAATPIVRLQRAANRQRILGDIARISASGGTNILSGLREAVDELLPAHARKKHIILLSDGQSPYEEIPDLVDAATAARITISAVGVGDGADQTLLKNVATRGGGRFYHTRDPASIPRIFSRETSELGDRSIVERPTGVRVAKRVAALAGVPMESAPALGGYVVTRPRAQMELVLATADGAPLFARWQLGLGQVAAWTSDLGARWAAAWSRWPPYEKLWAQVARATMRRRAATHFPIRAARAGDLVRLTVDAVGADDRFMVGLDGSMQVIAVSAGRAPAPPRALPMAETAPGRYEANFHPDVETGALLFSATLSAGTVPAAAASGRMTLPFAPELRPHPPAAAAAGGAGGPADGAPGGEGPSLLAATAARTGGRLIGDVRELYETGEDHRETHQPLRTPILLATALLFVIDVFFRRVQLPRDD